MKTSQKITLIGILAATIGLLTAFHDPSEEAAIKAVIEQETAGYFNGDLAAWAKCFKQDAHTVVCGAALSGPMVNQGWNAIRTEAEDTHKKFPGPWKNTVTRDNWHIQQSGNTAFAIFDQTVTFTDWPGTSPTKEIRCLEKVGGVWKIVAISWTDKTDLDSEAQREAIKAVIAAESQAFFTHDYDGWAANWVQEAGSSLTVNNDDGSLFHFVGFEQQIAAAIKDAMKGEKTAFNVTRDNWDIHIAGSVANVRFDQHFTDDKGKTTHSREFRILGWDGARWKIAQVNAFLDYKNAK